MTASSKVLQVTSELNDYLNANNFFDGRDEVRVNADILEGWNGKFISAISDDIHSRIDNISVDFTLSEFELASPDERGVCLFFHKLVITDLITAESLKLNSKILVDHKKSSVYLDSGYANLDQWKGESKKLESIFDRLKTAHNKNGYFMPFSWTDLINQV